MVEACTLGLLTYVFVGILEELLPMIDSRMTVSMFKDLQGYSCVLKAFSYNQWVSLLRMRSKTWCVLWELCSYYQWVSSLENFGSCTLHRKSLELLVMLFGGGFLFGGQGCVWHLR